MIAGELENGDYSGRLEVQKSGPYTIEEIASDTGMRMPLQRKALEELVTIGFLSKELTGTFVVERWDEKTGDESRLANQRERARRSRQKKSSRDAPWKSSRDTSRDASRDASRTLSQQNVTEEEYTSPPSDSRCSSSSGAGSAASAPEPPPPAWQEQLRASMTALRRKRLAALTPDDRLILGRYHALEFANCTKTEAFNKRHGSQIAGGFASMGRHKSYGELTVGQYVAHARKHHKNREKTPWFDPWQIKAVVEFEEQTA